MRKTSKKIRVRRILFLGFASVFIIFITTYTIGKYWFEIFEKYQEKNRLREELVYLKAKEGEFILKIPEE